MSNLATKIRQKLPVIDKLDAGRAGKQKLCHSFFNVFDPLLLLSGSREAKRNVFDQKFLHDLSQTFIQPRLRELVAFGEYNIVRNGLTVHVIEHRDILA